MTPIQLRPEFLAALEQLKLETFTVHELTEIYLNAFPREHSSHKSARQFVYRNMQRMMKAGLMARNAIDGGWPKYSLTSSVKHELIEPPSLEVEQSTKEDIPSSFNTQSILQLKERLHRHRSDMLSAIGEAEEYDELCLAHPNLKGEAQSLYNKARERSALLLGKVKALETLLASETARWA